MAAIYKWDRKLKIAALCLGGATILVYLLSLILVVSKDRYDCPSGCVAEWCQANDGYWYQCSCPTVCVGRASNYTVWPGIVMLVLLGAIMCGYIGLTVYVSRLLKIEESE